MSILNPNNSNLPNQYVENPNPENTTNKGLEFAKKIAGVPEDSDADFNFSEEFAERTYEDYGEFGQDPSKVKQDAQDKVDEAVNRIRHNIDVGDIFSGAVDNSVGAGPGMGYVADQFDNEFNPFNGENQDNDNGGLLNIPGVSIPGVSLGDVETPNVNFNPFEGFNESIEEFREILEIGLIGVSLVLILREVLKSR